MQIYKTRRGSVYWVLIFDGIGLSPATSFLGPDLYDVCSLCWTGSSLPCSLSFFNAAAVGLGCFSFGCPRFTHVFEGFSRFWRENVRFTNKCTTIVGQVSYGAFCSAEGCHSLIPNHSSDYRCPPGNIAPNQRKTTRFQFQPLCLYPFTMETRVGGWDVVYYHKPIELCAAKMKD